MTPAYGAATTVWYVQLAVYWRSWLLWPALLGVVWAWRRASHRPWAWRVGHGVALLLLLLLLYARFIEPQRIVVRHTALDLGFQARIAVIADYHLGIYKGSGFLQRVVGRLNAMELDAVLIAGDHVHEPDRPLTQLLAPLRGLRHTTLSVPGNHDEHKPGPEVRAALIEHGVVPVEYTHVALHNFTVVGLGDRYANKDDLRAVRDARDGMRCKAQSTAMPRGIASSCNAAARP
jgi:uncharacterized protein